MSGNDQTGFTAADVLAGLRLFTPISAGEEQAALAMCGDCVDRARRALRPGADPNDRRVFDLALGEALYERACREAFGEKGSLSSVKAGDLSIGRDVGHTVSLAEKRLRAARAEAAELLADEDFYFRSVP